MDKFGQINRNRVLHGYTHKNLRQYKRYCNKQFLASKKEGCADWLLYKLESNHAKYLLFNSRVYLQKNIRLLRKQDSEFTRLYGEYQHLFSSKGVPSIEDLVSLRHKLADFCAFLDDIYMLCGNKHDFDQYRISYQWHDITLLFETQGMRDLFLEGKLDASDHRFNTQVARRIITLEKAHRAFCMRLQSPSAQIAELHCSANEMLAAATDFSVFLDDNFLPSEYVKGLTSSIELVHRYIVKMADCANGAISPDVDNFIVPSHFAEHAESFESLRMRRLANPQCLRSLVLKAIENRVGFAEETGRMPFLPIFYDLAFDYICYPNPDKDIAASLSEIDIANRDE